MERDCIRPDAVLAVLGDPTRRAVLETVASSGEATATRLAGELPVSRQAVARHLSVLDEAGLVSSRREGREVLYRAHSEPIRVTARWLNEVAASWDARLEAIRRIAEAPEPTRRHRGNRRRRPGS